MQLQFYHLLFFVLTSVFTLDLDTLDENNGSNMEIKYYPELQKRILESLRNDDNEIITINRNLDDLELYTAHFPSNGNSAVTKRTRLFKDGDEKNNPLDSWSVVWYIASFGGLIAFFMVVSCSEWCCRRNARLHACNLPPVVPSTPTLDTPPPSYEEFAPPSYDSCLGKIKNMEKSEFDVYVVPVQALSEIMEMADQPPRYEGLYFKNEEREVFSEAGEGSSRSGDIENGLCLNPSALVLNTSLHLETEKNS